ncbi:MAG: ABC transporter ATP-binding protein [Candidatus Bathyarchaeia archaeon]
MSDLRTYFHSARGVVKAVDGVSLDIRAGEVVGLVGESGSGKTALVQSILRLVPTPPAEILGGSVQFNGKELLKLSEPEMRNVRGRDIAIIFQDPMTYLNPVMKVGDQVAEAIALHQGLDPKEAEERTIKLFEMVRMPSPETIVGYFPHQLSGGMRQRVLIALAISCEPALVIADEPTTALDTIVQAQILALLRELKDNLKISLLLITHDLGVIAEICDRAYVMYAGKIVEGANTLSLYRQPKHPYTQRMLAAANSMWLHADSLVTVEGAVPDLTNPPNGCRFHPRCPIREAKCTEIEPPIERKTAFHEVACWKAD